MMGFTYFSITDFLEGDLFGNVFQKGNLCILLVDCNSDKNNV